MTSQYDYIIVGAGGAGLSLLMRLLDEPALAQKKILLIDRGPKTGNDRTWCFWEKGKGYFDSILHKQWEKLNVKHPKGDLALDMGGFAYKMLRSADFYKHCFSRIKQYPGQVQLVYGKVSEIDTVKGRVTVDGVSYEANLIFSSVLPKPPQLSKKDFYLLQHFRGWWIETDEDIFDPAKADLMNFRVPQTHGCTFVYVLPLSARSALVEYTLFSGEELTSDQYDAGLRQFLATELHLKNYSIKEVENGIIPMTNFGFTKSEGKVVYIGTAGGQTKASTGYTFTNMQKHAEAITKGLVLNNPQLLTHGAPARFSLYDSILLRVLAEQKMPGADVFFNIFRHNPAHRVFRFLDNASSFSEELAIMFHSPRSIFSMAALRQIF